MTEVTLSSWAALRSRPVGSPVARSLTDFARDRIGRVSTDAGQFETLGVGDRYGTTIPIDTMLRCDSIELSFGRQAAFGHPGGKYALEYDPRSARLLAGLFAEVGK